MSRTLAPTRLLIRTYLVGFGDCFLLSFAYPGGVERHVLVDFGTRKLPRGAERERMCRIAEDIEAVCGGHLHAVVVTHRHLDHHSGFAGEAGKILARCKPDRVIQPWTEDPRAKEPAGGGKRSGGHRAAFFAMREAAPQILAHVEQMVARASRADRRAGKALAQRFATLAAINAGDRDAVGALERLAPPEHHRYVHAGGASGLEDLLPGVKVRVLGPPTLEQSAAIARYASSSDEYWLTQGARARAWEIQAEARRADAGEPFADAERLAPSEVPTYARWFLRRIDEASEDESFSVLHALDDALNNSSVMLLFELGKARLLLPGDAQLESWAYALAQPGVAEALRGVTLYKVGHHGSRNATPVTLWKGFSHRGPKGSAGRLRTLLPSMRGVYPGGKGKGEAGEGEVPRRPLVEALKRDSDCLLTESASGLCVPLEVPLRG